MSRTAQLQNSKCVGFQTKDAIELELVVNRYKFSTSYAFSLGFENLMMSREHTLLGSAEASFPRSLFSISLFPVRRKG